MKTISLVYITLCLFSCTSLSYDERQQLAELKYKGVTVDHAPKGWERPANPWAAGSLNLLPGFGNFYLASGEGGDSSQYLYGFLNLLTWPISPIWGIPEAAIDANTINKREMVAFYRYGRYSGNTENNRN